MGLDEAQTHAWMLFFIALHDYGKWDIRFQLKAIDALKALLPAFELDLVDPEGDYYHGPGGYAWLLGEDSRHLGFSDEQLYSWKPWLRAVTGHHGDLPDSTEATKPRAEAFIIDRDRQARLAWLQTAALRPTVQKEDAEPDASVQCVQWLGASRERAFLGQIGVRTVDQVLLSVLPVRHQFVRAFGVRKSLLIIDKIHAYDAYMYGLLTQVLRGQGLVGGSALLLSATLPLQQKTLLVEAWGGELPQTDHPEMIPYPLITQVAHTGEVTMYELPREARPAPRQVQVERHIAPDLLPDAALCQRIINAAA
jgi:hypothetical protein